MNKVVLIIYEDNGVLLFDESQFTAVVDDLEANMKKNGENIDDLKGLIRRQSSIMFPTLNISKEVSIDLEMCGKGREKSFKLSIVLKLNSSISS
jgi:hypothetical protein